MRNVAYTEILDITHYGVVEKRRGEIEKGAKMIALVKKILC